MEKVLEALERIDSVLAIQKVERLQHKAMIEDLEFIKKYILTHTTKIEKTNVVKD